MNSTLSWSWLTLGISLRWLRWGRVCPGGAAGFQGEADLRQWDEHSWVGSIFFLLSQFLHTHELLPDLNPSVWWHFKYPRPCPEVLVTAAEGSVWSGGTRVLFTRLSYSVCDWWGHLITVGFTIHIACLTLWRHSRKSIDFLCNGDLGLRKCFKYLFFFYVALRNTCIAANQL